MREALLQALQNEEITIATYFQLCEDFNLKPF